MLSPYIHLLGMQEGVGDPLAVLPAMRGEKYQGGYAMTQNEWEIRNIDNMLRLAYDETPKTERERDIRNLEFILYGINKYDKMYRLGCVATLRRAIKDLEGSKNT
jgi:hypothetical protein